MNDSSGRGRSPRWQSPQRPRLVAIMTATGGVALLAAACSSSPHPSAASGGSAYFQKALAYAQCMRSHGVPDYPDPNSLGQFPQIQANGGGANRSGFPQQALNSAQTDCRHLMPGGGTGTAAQQEAKQAHALAFSQCMRTHGVPAFPDPSTINGGIGYNLSGVDTSSPQYQSANQVCQSQSGKGQSPAGGQ